MGYTPYNDVGHTPYNKQAHEANKLSTSVVASSMILVPPYIPHTLSITTFPE